MLTDAKSFWILVIVKGTTAGGIKILQYNKHSVETSIQLISLHLSIAAVVMEEMKI